MSANNEVLTSPAKLVLESNSPVEEAEVQDTSKETKAIETVAASSSSPIKEFDPNEQKDGQEEKSNNDNNITAQVLEQAQPQPQTNVEVVQPQQPSTVIEESGEGSTSYPKPQGLMLDPSSSWGSVVQNVENNNQQAQQHQNQIPPQIQQQLNYKNRWNEVQEHELIAHSSMDRKRQNLEMLREWDMRRAYFLNIHRQLLEKISLEVEARWECSNSFAQFVLQYMENKSQQQQLYTQFQCPKPDVSLQNNQLAKTSYSHLRGALQFIDDANYQQALKVAKFNGILNVEIIQNLLAVDFNDSLMGLIAAKQELAALKGRMAELNGIASRKSGKVALVYNMSTPKTGYKKITQKPKDLYRSQLNFLRHAEIQTETQRHLAKVVLNAWETARKVEVTRTEAIQKALVLYAKSFIECYGESEQLNEQLKQISGENKVTNLFEIDEILGQEDIAFLREQLYPQGQGISQNDNIEGKVGVEEGSVKAEKKEEIKSEDRSEKVENQDGEKEQKKKKEESESQGVKENQQQKDIKEGEQIEEKKEEDADQADKTKTNQNQQQQQEQQQQLPLLAFSDLLPFFENFLVEGFDNRLLILKEFLGQRNVSLNSGFSNTHLVITADNYLHCFDSPEATAASLARSFSKPSFSLSLHKALLRRVSTKNFTVELSIQSTGLLNYLAGGQKYLFNFRNSDEIEELAQFINSLN